jgi:hypothetical protein
MLRCYMWRLLNLLSQDSYMLDDPRIEQALRGLEADNALLTRKLSLLEDLPLTR